MSNTRTNLLIDESSPYLRQHATNPVAWQPWGDAALEQARNENKLLLVSIGYAACHWCHVMEKECFEDEGVAEVMNTHFVCIKVDREERPDVDHIYMDALQLMTGGGGWPLNVVALPDGRPFWGATYVRKPDWTEALNQLATLYTEQPRKVEEYARNLTEGLHSINAVTLGKDRELFPAEELEQMLRDWSSSFDSQFGGYLRAPKFMMPVQLEFFLHYIQGKADHPVSDHLSTTLTRMAYGGIFDQVGGGFSRYSVDNKWHIPHFEKMLYDNAQLISLYARAYAHTRNPLFEEVVRKCIRFVQKDLMSAEGGFYASLDADSRNEEGISEEGAYYVWREAELKSLLGEDYPLFADYYNINDFGHWEAGKYVLIRNADEEEIAGRQGVTRTALSGIITRCLSVLEEKRRERHAPALDDKILTSWNALMIQALCDACRYLGDRSYLEMALRNVQFLEKERMLENHILVHSRRSPGEYIPGYLEDYACMAQAYLNLYEVTFEEGWLEKARVLINHCLTHFHDADSGLFFFTPTSEKTLVRSTLETSDNVIPASNSILAHALFRLSRYFPDAGYDKTVFQMISSMQPAIRRHPQNHAHWLRLYLYHTQPFYEIAITGPGFSQQASSFLGHYLPHTLLAGSGGESQLPLLLNRFQSDRTLIWLCRDGSCRLPESEPEAVLNQLRLS